MVGTPEVCCPYRKGSSSAYGRSIYWYKPPKSLSDPCSADNPDCYSVGGTCGSACTKADNDCCNYWNDNGNINEHKDDCCKVDAWSGNHTDVCDPCKDGWKNGKYTPSRNEQGIACCRKYATEDFDGNDKDKWQKKYNDCCYYIMPSENLRNDPANAVFFNVCGGSSSGSSGTPSKSTVVKLTCTIRGTSEANFVPSAYDAGANCSLSYENLKSATFPNVYGKITCVYTPKGYGAQTSYNQRSITLQITHHSDKPFNCPAVNDPLGWSDSYNIHWYFDYILDGSNCGLWQGDSNNESWGASQVAQCSCTSDGNVKTCTASYTLP